MRRKIAMTLAAASAATVLVLPGVGADANPVVECDGAYPVFSTTATTEDENRARIACMADRRAEVRERLAIQRQRRAKLTERIQELKTTRRHVAARIGRTRDNIKPLSTVIWLLNEAEGYIDWLNSTSACESGNDPQKHDLATGRTYHGKLQFHLNTWQSLQIARLFGISDPHTAPAIVQDAGGVELLERSGDEQWPRCGD